MTAKIARISEEVDTGMVIIEMHHVDENDESLYFDVYITDTPPETVDVLDEDEFGRVNINGEWVNRWVEENGEWVERPDFWQARRITVDFDYDAWLDQIVSQREDDVEHYQLRGGSAYYSDRRPVHPKVKQAADRRPQAPPGLVPREHPKKPYKPWKERPARDLKKNRPIRKER